MAPKLFEEGYDCDQIMRASPAAKPHGSARNGMEPWRRWVRDMINADVPRSGRRQPYSYVARPRPPKPRYVSRRQPATPSYSGLQAAQRGVAPSNSLQDLSSPRDIARVPSATERNGSAATGVAPSTNTAAARRDHHEVPNVGKRASAGPTSLRKTRFPNLTDRMIAYGPSAAEAILAYLEQPTDGRTRPLLSPKAREGLAWVRAIKGDPPLRLRNAIEYLLINLKTSGVDLDDLFASYATPLQKTVPVEPDAMPSQGAAALSDHELPPLPDLPQARLELLRAHAQALEEIGVGRRTFEERKAFRVAFQKLRDRSADLRPTEVAELQSVYEELRRRDKEKWK